MSLRPATNDTSPEAERVRIRVLREMPLRRKIMLVEDANRTARRLALAGIAIRSPQASPEERIRLLMDLVLGEEMAARVYGPNSVPRGR